jgi:filamentous hemagglutinin
LTAGSTLVGAAAGAAAGDAGIGATVAINATVNNYLKHDEIEKKLVAEQQCTVGSAEACATVRELDALNAQRDRDLANACASPSSDACRSQQAEVRSAQADIIRLGLSDASVTAQLERLHTQAQADGTMSTGSKLAGLAAGFVQSTAEGLSAMADGIATLVLAGQGDAASSVRLSQFAGNAMKLADPTLLAQVLSAADDAQREQLASAYERGDAYAIGKIGGEVLASLPVGVGSNKGVGGIVKTAERLAIEAAAANAVAKGALSVETQASLVKLVADLRATLTGGAKTGGNIGVAQIDIPGIQSTMAASSRIASPSADQRALGFVGDVWETFPSTIIPTGSNPPLMLNRAVDSEAKILNNIAAQLGENISVTGTINLLTERAPCASCSKIIDQFRAKYSQIIINVIDSGGVVRPSRSP